jgi:hypothetical protein
MATQRYDILYIKYLLKWIAKTLHATAFHCIHPAGGVENQVCRLGIACTLHGHCIRRTKVIAKLPTGVENRRRHSTGYRKGAWLMAELHIDDDWKKQAQEEKRKLAEAQEKQKAEQAKAAAAAPAAGGGGSTGVGGGKGRRQQREVPTASFASIVNSLLTQAMLYLGELAPQGSEPMLNLDMAKYQVDMLGILEDKTRNNLAPEEQHLLDSALYDVRTRFINVASQYM